MQQPDAPQLTVELVFDRPLDTAYSYSVPEHLHSEVAVGKRAECSFGRGDRRMSGYIVSISEQIPLRPLKPIDRILDQEPLVDDHLLKLTRWMADYYLCGWGQVLHALVPAGVRGQAGTREFTLVSLADPLPNPTPAVSAKQKLVLEVLRKHPGAYEVGQLARDAGVSPGLISTLVSKGLLTKAKERRETGPPEAPRATTSPDIPMNADQIRVWDRIQEAITQGGYQPFLLHGVTGSGKTEVYLRAIEQVVRQGREAIVLVPEISLTPQTTERFRGRFGSVAILHSHLTDRERATYWRRVAQGQVNVVVGARSAVFAPTRRLGLIVIDEEHETSFKQETTPRYHARDVALMRSRLAGVPIILGSATPSLESWHAAQEELTLLSLPNRVENRPLPKVGVIDMRYEKKRQGPFTALSAALEQEMHRALEKKGQVILLLNRRGFSTHIHCPSCGYVVQCAHCDLAMTFHRAKSVLICHHCAAEQAPIVRCPHCVDSAIRYQGLGTEKLQTELETRFPSYVSQRMDSDTMAKPGSHQRIFDAFRAGEIQILLGTQMIAKGLDFPNVTLVGVINADASLHMPDFRSAERTFQLLAQVAGRAGRGDQGGRVLIQTYTPEHACIQLATKHDYITFANSELRFRHDHLYPPYQKMTRIIIRSEKAEAAGAFADQFARALGDSAQRFREATSAAPSLRILGPAECPVFKLHDHYRFHFQIHSVSSEAMHEVLHEVMTTVRPPHGVEYQVDVDPYSML